jgi:hypothetical protein
MLVSFGKWQKKYTSWNALNKRSTFLTLMLNTPFKSGRAGQWTSIAHLSHKNTTKSHTNMAGEYYNQPVLLTTKLGTRVYKVQIWILYKTHKIYCCNNVRNVDCHLWWQLVIKWMTSWPVSSVLFYQDCTNSNRLQYMTRSNFNFNVNKCLQVYLSKDIRMMYSIIQISFFNNFQFHIFSDNDKIFLNYKIAYLEEHMLSWRMYYFFITGNGWTRFACIHTYVKVARNIFWAVNYLPRLLTNRRRGTAPVWRWPLTSN